MDKKIQIITFSLLFIIAVALLMIAFKPSPTGQVIQEQEEINTKYSVFDELENKWNTDVIISNFDKFTRGSMVVAYVDYSPSLLDELGSYEQVDFEQKYTIPILFELYETNNKEFYRVVYVSTDFRSYFTTSKENLENYILEEVNQSVFWKNLDIDVE